MKINYFSKLRNSLFLKILLVFILGYAAIGIFSIITHETLLRNARFPKIQRNGVNYSNYIIKDLGNPPDTLAAKRLTDELNIQIRFKNDALEWKSHPETPEFTALDLPVYDAGAQIRAGFQDQKGLFIDRQQDGWRYLIVLQSDKDSFSDAVFWNDILKTAFMTLVILLIFFIVRRLLYPVKSLHEGVLEISKGNLDHEISTRRNDELGELVRAFNAMRRRIGEMIHARDQLLLDVSHELRSPLTRIKLALEFIKEGEAKKMIDSDVRNTETMITEILESERLNSPHGVLHLKQQDIADIIQEVCAIYREHKPGVDFPADFEETNLEFDPERVRIVLNNIITNALKHSDAGARPVEVFIEEQPDSVIVGVRDHGIGIPEKELPFIFEPFYRVDKSRAKKSGGYGLGLSLSKKIMEAHGGEIEIESTLGTGTTVILRFPRK